MMFGSESFCSCSQHSLPSPILGGSFPETRTGSNSKFFVFFLCLLLSGAVIKMESFFLTRNPSAVHAEPPGLRLPRLLLVHKFGQSRSSGISPCHSLWVSWNNFCLQWWLDCITLLASGKEKKNNLLDECCLKNSRSYIFFPSGHDTKLLFKEASATGGEVSPAAESQCWCLIVLGSFHKRKMKSLRKKNSKFFFLM